MDICSIKDCDEPTIDGKRCKVHESRWRAKRKWRERHHEYYIAYRRKYRAEHAEYFREADRKQYRKDPAKYVEYVRQYRKAHPGCRKGEHQKAQQRDPIKAGMWRQCQTANRRGKQFGRPGKVTVVVLRAIYAKQDGKCFDCGKQGWPLTLGHGIPLFYKAGTNHADNLMYQCRACNGKQSFRVHPRFGDGY